MWEEKTLTLQCETHCWVFKYQPTELPEYTRGTSFCYHAIRQLDMGWIRLERDHQQDYQGPWLNKLKIRDKTGEVDSASPLRAQEQSFFVSYLEQPGRWRREERQGRKGFSWLPAGDSLCRREDTWGWTVADEWGRRWLLPVLIKALGLSSADN